MSEIIIPAYLKPGDTIGVVCTARKISVEEINLALSVFEKWGLRVVLGKNMLNSYNQFSGTDEERAEDLQTMLDDPNIKAVISARGGYGTVRIIDHIDFNAFKKSPKWVIGYSDITVLHSHIHQYNVASIHATMPINFGVLPEATESLRRALMGEKNEYLFQAHAFNRNKNINGKIVGGNLSLLYALNNTPSDLNTDGKILFIEDLDEYLYHVDRMMMNMKRSGKLKNLKALVVGGMSDMKDNAVPFGKTAEEIILDTVKTYDYPVFFNFPCGHIDQNMALKLGADCSFQVNGDQIFFTQE